MLVGSKGGGVHGGGAQQLGICSRSGRRRSTCMGRRSTCVGGVKRHRPCVLSPNNPKLALQCKQRLLELMLLELQ